MELFDQLPPIAIKNTYGKFLEGVGTFLQKGSHKKRAPHKSRPTKTAPHLAKMKESPSNPSKKRKKTIKM